VGIHNVYNSLSVWASLHIAGVNMDLVNPHFETFTGMGRRFQKVSEFAGIDVYDDYAHHPSEIRTTITGIKSVLKGDKRLVAIFQPHRYTRLQSLWNEFKKAFDSSDLLIVTDVYSAGEDEIENINSKNFEQDLKSNNSRYISGNMHECAKQILPLLQKNDIVITLGAGNITELGKLLCEEAKVHYR
jgi:UDP-N-acetylmuramate--alanine ligase